MKTLRRAAPAVLAAVLLCAAGGCSDDDDIVLAGTGWALRSAVVDGNEVFIGPYLNPTIVTFSATTYEVDDTCNVNGGEYRQIGITVVTSNRWGTDQACLLGGYYPIHFDGPFDVEIRGTTLFATNEFSTHIYEAR